MATPKKSSKVKVYTNVHGPKGKKLYVGKKRLSTGRIKYIYSKDKTSRVSGIASSKPAVPSARKG